MSRDHRQVQIAQLFEFENGSLGTFWLFRHILVVKFAVLVTKDREKRMSVVKVYGLLGKIKNKKIKTAWVCRFLKANKNSYPTTIDSTNNAMYDFCGAQIDCIRNKNGRWFCLASKAAFVLIWTIAVWVFSWDLANCVPQRLTTVVHISVIMQRIIFYHSRSSLVFVDVYKRTNGELQILIYQFNIREIWNIRPCILNSTKLNFLSTLC